jgi:rhodanese-related sulfurtransferase
LAQNWEQEVAHAEIGGYVKGGGFFMKALVSLLFLTASLSAFAAGGGPVVVDVRTPEEYAQSHIKGAKNIDVMKDDFAAEIAKLDKKAAYKVYCRSGRRSGKALETMKGAGFSDVENLGSIEQAVVKLKASCEGKKPCQAPGSMPLVR